MREIRMSGSVGGAAGKPPPPPGKASSRQQPSNHPERPWQEKASRRISRFLCNLSETNLQKRSPDARQTTSTFTEARVPRRLDCGKCNLLLRLAAVLELLVEE